MNTTIWLEMEPVDTLFFRGAEAMEAGEDHEVATMFPPMPSTIIGAIRTAILRQHGIAPADYLEKSEIWRDKLPFLGTPEKPGFDLLGPLFLTGDDCPLLPVPAHWFADLPESSKIEWGSSYRVQAARELKKNSLGLTGSVSTPFWVRNPAGSDMKTLAGYWATPAAFRKLADGKGELVFREDLRNATADEAFIVPQSALFVREERVGIALTKNRTAREGHLYGSVHIRLRDGAKLLAGCVSGHEFPLKENGILQLGGEQRVCSYRVIDCDLRLGGKEGLLYALSPVVVQALPAELQDRPRASGKLLRVGGWDMHKKFHKPMTAFLPAGTVISAPETDIELPQFIHI